VYVPSAPGSLPPLPLSSGTFEPVAWAGGIGYGIAAARMTLLVTEEEPVIVEPEPEVEEHKWSINEDTSVFYPRKGKYSGKDYYDTPRVVKQAFNRDWGRLLSLPRLWRFVEKHDAGVREGDQVRFAVRRRRCCPATPH
jgi:hypothetical protein